MPGADLDGICYLRDLDDATQLRPRLTGASRVVVVGGGFVGLEAAAVARARRSVTVVEATDRLIAPRRRPGRLRLLPRGARAPRDHGSPRHRP